MSPLLPPTGPLQAGEVGADLVMMAVGAVCVWMFGRQVAAHPPEWVRSYNGWASFVLGLPYVGLALVLAPAVVMSRNALPLVVRGILSLLVIACFLVFLLSWFIWFPRFLLPGWYRRAKHAGVDVHEPASVEAFRQLPKAEQQARVAQAREVRARLKARSSRRRAVG